MVVLTHVSCAFGFVRKSGEVLMVDLVDAAVVEGECAGPTTFVEEIFSEVLAELVGCSKVSVEGHFFDDLGADSMVMARFCAKVRKRADIPSVSMADVYRHPTVRALAGALVAPPPTSLEKAFGQVLADLMDVPQVAADSHFFDDLGADSMVMAQFCARVRKRPDLPSVSMQDVYRSPTIRGLATALVEPAPAPAEAVATAPVPQVQPVGRIQYVLCGVLQLLVFLGFAYLSGLILERGFEWISAGSGLVDIYLRSVLFGVVGFVALCLLPILAKWVLIGRWRPRQIRIWSPGYVRFWLVKSLVRSNPLLLVAGGRSRTSSSSPLHVLYLRALGARVGRGVAIFSRNVPVCTDLLTIGDGTVIRKDSFFNCYRAQAGLIQTGTVTLGQNVFVGEATVVDIDTSMGDESQLGHSSSLHSGQAVPDGEHWHGTPARRTDVDYESVEPAGCGTLRRVVYPALQLLGVLVVGLPLLLGGVSMLLLEFPKLAALLDPRSLGMADPIFYLDALIASVVLFFGSSLVALLVVVTVPRVLNRLIEPDQVYRLYGIHYWAHHAISRMTNLRFFTILFGDSSYIVNYLGRLGHDLSQVEQTGSNFGLEVKHESPYLSSVGSGTMVADGLSIMNAEFSSTSFRVSRASIGAHNFLGNRIAYPAQGRTGDNCLLATKVMVPLDGRIREGVGLLGSPSFEIPRSVRRDVGFDLESRDELHRRLAAKNRHNIVTMVLFLLAGWVFFLGVTLIAMAGVDLYKSFGATAIAAATTLIVVFTVAYFVLIARAVMSLQTLRPAGCSIYDVDFWRHERFWKLSVTANFPIFNGTPFKSVIWRLLGMRVGKRLFDDGCEIVEKTMVTIGDDVILNAGSVIQCHSQEDGAFKSDRVTIGSGVTLGVGAFVHYGTTVGDGSVLEPDSFLMKGEEVPPRTRWAGNPAMEVGPVGD
ncbi:Pls/PosA family non-ribosomal peptide synthetase [Pseudonocardia xinjiangensis]|uniref:Pls/PosA family non-ribosomal peptide synthetase n=1 Tax=Pseudonocardia xinjiangensis TaxID=75289 RepID=UPI003D8D565B